MRTLLFLSVMILVSCSYYKAKPGQNTQPTAEMTDFSWLQANLFDPDCVKCHSSGLNLTNFNSMQKALGALVAGDPAASAIYRVIADGVMPPSGRLSQESSLAVLQCWIEAGATEDSTSCLVGFPQGGSTGSADTSASEEGGSGGGDGDGDDDSADDHSGDDDGEGDDNDDADPDDDGQDDGADGEDPDNDSGDGAPSDDGADDASDGDPSPPAVMFAAVADAVFTPHCLSCHSAASPSADLSVASFEDVVASGYVVPGDPDGSVLWEAIESDFMPFGLPLSGEQKALVRQWIEEGAQP